MLVRLIA